MEPLFLMITIMSVGTAARFMLWLRAAALFTLIFIIFAITSLILTHE